MARTCEQRSGIELLNRRTLLLSAGAGALLFSRLQAVAEDAIPQTLERTKQFEEAFAALTAGASPVEGRVTLELPDVAENGNFVPLTVSVESPMTDADYVKTIHILSTSNPVARVASFHLSPINGVAKVQSRMRLAKTQDVIALVHLSTGAVLAATALVKVTIGGCSG